MESSNSVSKSDLGECKKRKRGIRTDDIYTRNIIKQARVEGSAYVNYGGKNSEARKIGPACR